MPSAIATRRKRHKHRQTLETAAPSKAGLVRLGKGTIAKPNNSAGTITLITLFNTNYTGKHAGISPFDCPSKSNQTVGKKWRNTTNSKYQNLVSFVKKLTVLIDTQASPVEIETLIIGERRDWHAQDQKQASRGGRKNPFQGHIPEVTDAEFAEFLGLAQKTIRTNLGLIQKARVLTR